MEAAELMVGEFVVFGDRVAMLDNVVPSREVGPDGRAKLVLTFVLDNGRVRESVATASEWFELSERPGTAPRPPRRCCPSAYERLSPFDPEPWEKKVVPKSEAERDLIRRLIKSNVFFADLDESEENDLLDVVFEKRFGPGDVLMLQGDEGDLFYVVESGDADIYVLDDSTNEQLVRSCKGGDSFGELALMCGMPRQATVRARNDLKCWCMETRAFKHVFLGIFAKKRDRYLGFFDSMRILDAMEEVEKTKMADALIPRKVEKDTVVVRQGDVGDMFYIVESGSLVVQQTTPEGKQEVVNVKKPGDFFGEITLMGDMPRSATVIASEDCVLLTLDSNTFVSLIGPMEPLLRSNLALYKSYIDFSDV